MRKINCIQIAIFLLFLPSMAYTNDITKFILDYQKCMGPEICKDAEYQLIYLLLKKQNILEVLEGMPEEEGIKYEIVQSSVTNRISQDYLLKIVIDNLGYLVIIKNNIQTKTYSLLPIITTGFIYNLQTKDMTGDGINEVMINGIGRGTGYNSKWLSIYKYKKNKMHQIWAETAEEVWSEKNVIYKVQNSIYFYNTPGKKSKEIIMPDLELILVKHYALTIQIAKILAIKNFLSL